MKKEDKKRYKVRLDEEGDWRYNEEEDTSIFSLLVWGLVMTGIVSVMFYLLT